MAHEVQVRVTDELWAKMQPIMKDRGLSAYGLAKEAIELYCDGPSTPAMTGQFLDIKADFEEYHRKDFDDSANVSWIEGRYRKSRREARAILAQLAWAEAPKETTDDG